MGSTRQVAVYWGVVAVLCLAAAPFVSLAAPMVEAEVFSCPVKVVAGLPCPTCGGTRATLALARLSLFDALSVNPGVTIAWLVLILGGLAALAVTLAGRQLPTLPRRLPMPVRLAAVALVVVNWIYLYKAGI